MTKKTWNDHNLFYKITCFFFQVEMLLYKEANNKYELMFSHEICDLCAEVAKGEDSDYISYMKYFGIPSECPFDAVRT